MGHMGVVLSWHWQIKRLNMVAGGQKGSCGHTCDCKKNQSATAFFLYYSYIYVQVNEKFFELKRDI